MHVGLKQRLEQAVFGVPQKATPEQIAHIYLFKYSAKIEQFKFSLYRDTAVKKHPKGCFFTGAPARMLLHYIP